MSYDPRCEELAELFLEDTACRTNAELYDKQRVELAQHIQSAIDEWLLFDMKLPTGEKKI